MITKINNKKWMRTVMAGVFSLLLLSFSSLLLSSCNEEPDGSNLFSSDQKTIAEMLRASCKRVSSTSIWERMANILVLHRSTMV